MYKKQLEHKDYIYLFKAFFFFFLWSWISSSHLSLNHSQLKSLTTRDMNNSEEFLTKTNLRAMRMFSHRIVLYSSNLSLITGVRCVLAQLELWNVFEGQTEWTFGLSVSLSVGLFPPNRRFVSTVCQRVWDTVSLRESQPSGHTQPHNDFWRARRKWGNDLVIYLGGTLHLWAQEFTDISSGWHCLTLNDLKSVKTTAMDVHVLWKPRLAIWCGSDAVNKTWSSLFAFSCLFSYWAVNDCN